MAEDYASRVAVMRPVSKLMKKRATVVIDGRPDRFEQTLSDSRVKGDMVAA